MPNWLKQACWILVALILLANWRQMGQAFLSVLVSLSNLINAGFFGYDDPVYRFAAMGVVIVALVAGWSIFCNSRRSREKDDNQN